MTRTATPALLLALLLTSAPALAAAPTGWLDRVDAQGVAYGWTADADSPGQSLWVHFYVEDAAGQRRFAGASRANLARADVRRAGWSGDHGFRHRLPSWALDGQQRLLYAYAIDPQSQGNPLLNGAPKSFRLSAPPPPSVELLGDAGLRRGLNVLVPSPRNSQDYVKDGAGNPVVLRLPGQSGAPSWKVAQHHMRVSLRGGPGTPLPGNGRRWADGEKAFSLFPGGRCVLAVNSKTSYQNRFRDPTDPNYKKDWPHLYVSQSIESSATTRIKDLSALRLNMQLKLLYANHDTGPGYNPAWHTGHFVFFLTVVDRKNRDYLWYGANLYDARGSSYYGASEKFDGDGTDNSTGKLIRQVALRDLTPHTLESKRGQWVTISRDLLPDIRASLQRNLAKGKLRGSLDEFEVASFLIGWEVPGLYTGTIEARGMSLRATPK